MIPIGDDHPTSHPAYVTVSLIAACVVVQLWQLSLGPMAAQVAIYRFGFIPAVLFDQARLPDGLAVLPPEATLVTSMFMHGDIMHLGGNMLYLWVFGNNIEDAMGHRRFVLFYLICGLAAAMAQALPAPGSQVPMVGASGAISGVLGAYLLLFPHARVKVLVPFLIVFLYEIRAGWLLGFWFVFQLLSGITVDAAGGGVAWWAHVGGFVAGMALIPLFKVTRHPAPRARGRSRLPSISSVPRRKSRPWDRRDPR